MWGTSKSEWFNEPREQTPRNSEAMDAGAYMALSAALQQQLPSALEDAVLALERQRMITEDIAAHGMSGKITCNPSLDLAARYEQAGGIRTPNCPQDYWCAVTQKWYDHLQEAKERSRLALQRVEVLGIPSDGGFPQLGNEIRELLDLDSPIEVDGYEDYEMDSESEDSEEETMETQAAT
jgi:hypothetical protein